MTACTLALTLLLIVGPAVSACDDPAQLPEQVRRERITGSLPDAENMVRAALACPSVPKPVGLQLKIELARILDRIGLHQNTRPVTAALEALEEAKAFLDPGDREARAHLDLALSDYYYRAEAGEREFPLATEYGLRAHRIFAELDDPVALTDATHRLGMIAFQRRELENAKRLILESLEISKEAPARPIFLGDFHRHYGFVIMLSGDLEAALPHFEDSLKYRLQAESPDYSLFAYNLLGSALVDAGRPAEAEVHLESALRIAEELPSPVGQLRATFNQGEMYEALQKPEAALAAFGKAHELAQRLASDRYTLAAAEEIERLTGSISE